MFEDKEINRFMAKGFVLSIIGTLLSLGILAGFIILILWLCHVI